MTTVPGARARFALRIRGVVQGVGFRPAMYRLARAHTVAGFVRNERGGVRIEVEGLPDEVARFIEALPRAIPPSARLDAIDRAPIPPIDEHGFRIEESPRDARRGEPAAAIPVDQAPCAACLRELDDRGGLRHRYPFINCTDCGPRFTIVRRVPYDRPCTTMAPFALCERCHREYEDPADRRFHAEPNACPACGPELAFVRAGAVEARADAALRAACDAISTGEIVAVKGAGGFLLAADARSERAVSTLRTRKRRPDKPFAVMARDLAAVERIAVVNDVAREALVSPARPIVLLPRAPGADVAPSVAPGLAEIGVFLAPTPLQHLLAADGPELQVMTSGNLSEEPIAKDDDDALRRLASIADAFLVHDRGIHARADDSVVRVIAGAPVILRRARGYVPDAVALPFAGPPVLAVGAGTKSTICLAQDGRAVLSQHLGDLDHPDALAFFEETVAHLRALTGIEPAAVACDLHPDYRSTRWARAAGLPVIAVQHHHAHVAACMAEHGRTERVLGVAFDGTGYGPDGVLWGGEILEADLASFGRVAHLPEIALPGGEAAIREPWRLAVSALVAAGEDPYVLPGVPRARVDAIRSLLERPHLCPRATGAGRWLDAVSAMLGLCHESTYDGQACIALEAAACQVTPRPLFDTMDVLVGVRGVVRGVREGAPRARIAAGFLEGMARAIAETCGRARDGGGPATVALSGGCFQNRILCERTKQLLEERRLEVLVHRRVPPNDGGIALGQAAIASFRLRQGAL